MGINSSTEQPPQKKRERKHVSVSIVVICKADQSKNFIDENKPHEKLDLKWTQMRPKGRGEEVLTLMFTRKQYSNCIEKECLAIKFQVCESTSKDTET